MYAITTTTPDGSDAFNFNNLETLVLIEVLRGTGYVLTVDEQDHAVYAKDDKSVDIRKEA